MSDDYLESRDRVKETEEYEGTRIPSGSDHVDRAMNGGIPLGSVTLFDGPSGSGKSVLCQHICFGALMTDLLVAYYVSRGTAEELAENMTSLGMDVAEDLESEQIRVFPLSEVSGRKRRTKSRFESLLEHIAERTTEGIDLVIIDDLAQSMRLAGPDETVRFVAEGKRMSRRGLTILTAVHQSAFDKEMAWRFHTLFDAHISLNLEGSNSSWQMEVINLMEIKKVENLEPASNNAFYFRVNPELGASMNMSLDVLPIFKIKV